MHRNHLHDHFAALARLVLLATMAASTQAAPPAQAANCSLDRATGTTIETEPLIVDGYETRWNHATNRLAYMKRDASGYYRIYTMRPDGSEQAALTAGKPGMPDKHQGAPYWHPSGRYLLFLQQKEEWHSPKLFGNPDYEALPGFGRHDDLWLITADGSKYWQLTRQPNTKDEGILLPVFSPDGQYIAWSERRAGGKYVLVRVRSLFWSTRTADSTIHPSFQWIGSTRP